jgi:hypothetical protein
MKHNLQYWSTPSVVIALLIVAFGMNACKKRSVNETVSACSAGKDSSFTVKDLVGLSDDERLFDVETIMASRNAIFLTANDSLADSYEWSFSKSPTVFSGRSVNIILDRPIGDLKITLTIKRSPSHPCFAERGAQSVYSRNVTVVEPDAHPLFGKYYGYNTSNKAKFVTVEVLRNGLKNIPFETTAHYYFQNEIYGGSSGFYIGGGGTFDPDYGAYGTQGWGYLLNNNKELKIEYQYKLPRNVTGRLYVKDTFYGLKQ